VKIFDFVEHMGETDHISYRKHGDLCSGLSLRHITDLIVCSFDFCHTLLRFCVWLVHAELISHLWPISPNITFFPHVKRDTIS